MIRYTLGRLAATVITLWLLATLGFILVELIPGDPARQLAGPSASFETVERIRHAYGFDRPFLTRYADALDRYAHGDLGYSFSRSEDVRSVIARDVGNTLLLTALAFTGEVAIAIPLAVFVVRSGRRSADWFLLGSAGATSALPTFLVGLLLLYVFAFRLGWFPLGGGGPIVSRAYVLPVLTVAVPYGLVLARLLRTSLLEEREKAYGVFALARGEKESSVIWRNLLPNALLPLLSVLALDFAGLFATVAVVEVVFSIRGVGSDIFGAIRRVDTPLIVGIAIISGIIVALVNLLADLAVLIIDPRLRAKVT